MFFNRAAGIKHVTPMGLAFVLSSRLYKHFTATRLPGNAIPTPEA
jgi:hypothetical protein